MMFATIAALLADNDGWNGHMGWDGGWWMLIWGTLMMAGFVSLVVWLVRSTEGGRPHPPREDPTASARRILAERFASGELTTDEYRERSAELG